MKLITFKDITDLSIKPETCYQWTCEMIARKDDVLLPPKISMKPADMDGVFCNVMPSMQVKTAHGVYGGVKMVTRYPDRTPSLDSQILLFDAQSGQTLALMDGDWITAMRTGAVAAHSILLLAKKEFSQIGMLGLGNTARATLLILAAMVPDRKLHIKLLRYKGQEKLFMERFADYPNLEFSVVEDNDALVRGSHVVISAATYLPQDVCGDDAFDEGVLVVPVHTLGFTNCDLFFDKIVADDYGHVCHFKYFDKFRKFAEVHDVVTGKCPGRENDRERITAYNIGVSVHDIYFAANIYQLLKDAEDVAQVDLEAPTDKYWV